MTLFRFNHHGLTITKFSSDIVRILSKRNRFSIGRCAKFVGHVRCPTAISHPGYMLGDATFTRQDFFSSFLSHALFKFLDIGVEITQLTNLCTKLPPLKLPYHKVTYQWFTKQNFHAFRKRSLILTNQAII